MVSSEVMPLRAPKSAVPKSLPWAVVVALAVWILANDAKAVRATADAEAPNHPDIMRSIEPGGADGGGHPINTLSLSVNVSNSASAAAFADRTNWLRKPANNRGAPQRRSKTSSLTVQGFVTDAQTHKPLSGARVILETPNPTSSEALSDSSALRAVTDERGHFRLDRVKPGFYMLSVLDPAYEPVCKRPVRLPAQDQSASFDVSLDPMIQVLGRVVDELDRPVSNVEVGIVLDDARASEAWRRVLSAYGKSALVTNTGDQGKFALFVPAKEERITLGTRASGYVLSHLGPISLLPSTAQKALVLRLSRGLSAGGRVIDDTGAPVAGAKIVALAASKAGPASGLAVVPPQATSGTDGRYFLLGLQEGVYELRASEATHLPGSLTGIELRSAKQADLPDIVLRSQSSIGGRVVDIDRQPIAGARVTSDFGGTKSIEAISDEQGAFVLRGFEDGAKGNVSATAPGYAKFTKAVSAPSRDVLLILEQAGMLRGHVEDSITGIGIKEFKIRKKFDSLEKSFETEDGVFAWADLTIGRSTFVAEAKGYQAAELADVDIRAGDTSTDVVFLLAKGAKLAGRVVNAAGAGIQGAIVTFRAGPEIDSVNWQNWRDRLEKTARTTDLDGSFEFDNLPFGRVMIVASAPIHHAAAERIVVAGEEKFIEMKLSVQASISGRVLVPEGTALPSGTTVWVGSPATGMSRTIPTDAAGMFSCDALAAGSYHLAAEAPALGKSLPIDIVLAEDERRTGLELRFVVKTGATIRVRILGLFPGEIGGLSARGAGGFTDDASIDDSGAFVIPGVPEGPVELSAVTSSQREVEKTIEIPKGAQDITLDIQLPGEGRLSGRVTKAGRPVGNQRVIASSSGPNSMRGVARTDPSGVYAIKGLGNGEYRVWVEGGAARTVQVAGDTVLDIDLP